MYAAQFMMGEVIRFKICKARTATTMAAVAENINHGRV